MSTRTVVCIFACIGVSACSSDPNRTHRGGLLDDKVTTQRVNAELTRAGREFKDIHVHTTNGVVELSGTVASAQTRTQAEGIVRKVHRVTDVEDNVQVQR